MIPRVKHPLEVVEETETGAVWYKCTLCDYEAVFQRVPERPRRPYNLIDLKYGDRRANHNRMNLSGEEDSLDERLDIENS